MSYQSSAFLLPNATTTAPNGSHATLIVSLFCESSKPHETWWPTCVRFLHNLFLIMFGRIQDDNILVDIVLSPVTWVGVMVGPRNNCPPSPPNCGRAWNNVTQIKECALCSKKEMKSFKRTYRQIVVGGHYWVKISIIHSAAGSKKYSPCICCGCLITFGSQKMWPGCIIPLSSNST